MVPPTRYAYLSYVWNRPSTWYCPNVRQSVSTMTQSALPESADAPTLPPPIRHINGETKGVDPSAAASSSIPAVSAPPKTTFYRRSLPDTCVAFSSPQGRQYFASAMQHRGLKSYFHLMEQYTTQSEPAFCGISTLVISLNALAVDPRQIWKGSWRWYEESMLNCCIDLEQAKETGITMATFNCLALCQGLSTEVHYVDEAKNANPNSTAPSLEHFRARVREACVQTDDDDAAVVDRVLIASYSRRALKQTGSGHFSPIAAYDEESDTVLIMDTARFKYGAHWIKVPLLYEAMQPIDPDTGRSRGYTMLIHRREEPDMDVSMHHPRLKNLPMAILLRSEMRQTECRRQFKQYLDGLGDVEKSYCNILQYFSSSNGNSSIWEMITPQLRPYDNDQEAKEMVNELRALIRALLATVRGSDASHCTMADSTHCGAHVEVDDSTRCRENHCRTVPLRTEEAIFIVYLACLEEKAREAMVLHSDIPATERSRWQLLAEAELVRYAIDTCDQIPTTTVASSS